MFTVWHIVTCFIMFSLCRFAPWQAESALRAKDAEFEAPANRNHRGRPGETGKTSGGRCELRCISGAFEPPCWKAPGWHRDGTGMVRVRNFNHLSFTKAEFKSNFGSNSIDSGNVWQGSVMEACWNQWQPDCPQNRRRLRHVSYENFKRIRACKIQRKSLDCNPAFDCLMMFDCNPIWCEHSQHHL